MSNVPRLIRPVPESLGLYFRVGVNDHRVVEQLLAEDYANFSGLVFDACHSKRHEELRLHAVDKGIHAVLDHRLMELGTPGGCNHKLLNLPWAATEPHSVSHFGAASDVIAKIAEHAVSSGYTAVLAPAHLLSDETDRWLSIDAASTVRLREELDSNGGENIQINYPLILPSKIFYRQEAIDYITSHLIGLPIDSLWLRIHRFGSGVGPRALRSYIEACRHLHSLEIPIVAEKTGTVGLALLAFGAVGGIESGITLGERFDAGNLLKKRPDSDGFLLSPRVYIQNLGIFLKKKDANNFFSSTQMKSLFACKEGECCPKGQKNMIDNPRRHFLISRIQEVHKLSVLPESLRCTQYMEAFLRPATDFAARGERYYPKLGAARKKLEAWRFTLGKMAPLQPGTTVSKLPKRVSAVRSITTSMTRH